MTHEEALNLILANSCPNDEEKDGITVHELELHCHTAVVTARIKNRIAVPAGPENEYRGDFKFEYDILSVEIK